MPRASFRSTSAAAALVALLLVPATGLAQSVSFSQLDFDLDGTLTPESDWGAVDLTFTGSTSILYFNLTVNGFWRLQNLPVLTTRGVGVLQTQRFRFALGSPVGVDVTALSYDFALTASPLVSPPPGAFVASVDDETVKIANAGADADLPDTPPPADEEVVGGEVAEPVVHAHQNFPNQEAGPGECAPTAVSNSLQFLNTHHDLDIPPEDITIEKMKTATNWGQKTIGSAAGPGVDRVEDPYPIGQPDPRTVSGAWIEPDPDAAEGEQNAWWQDKAAYMEENDLPITTRQIQPEDIGTLAREIDRGQDVEAEVGGHTVAVVGIANLGDGRYSVTVAHDTKQGEAGGTVEETSIWDSNTSTWEGALAGSGLSYFVVECPDYLHRDEVQALPGDGIGGGSYASFGMSDLPALPSDFFDPGSEPFVGLVSLQGAQHPASALALQRYGDPLLPVDPLLSAGSVDVEIAALSLVSVQPIVVSSNGATQFDLWNVSVSLSPPETWQIDPLGTIDATKVHANGGHFAAELYVQPVFTFTRANPPFDTRVLDTRDLVPPLRLSAPGLPWVHEPDPVTQLSPAPTVFRPGVSEVVFGDPSSQQVLPMALPSDGGGLTLVLLLTSSVVTAPAASGFVQLVMMLLLGLGGVLAIRHERRG